MRKSQTGQREKWLIFESRWGGVRGQFQLAKWDPQLVAKTHISHAKAWKATLGQSPNDQQPCPPN
jgi:hypothetical protein